MSDNPDDPSEPSDDSLPPGDQPETAASSPDLPDAPGSEPDQPETTDSPDQPETTDSPDQPETTDSPDQPDLPDPPASPDTRWAYDYWPQLSQAYGASEKREAILATLCETEYGTFSTQELAEAVETRLQTQGVHDQNQTYTSTNLNQVLPQLEPLGPVYRIPKFNQDDEYILLLSRSLLTWIRKHDLQDYMTPEMEPEGWNTTRLGKYITSQLESTDDIGEQAGNLIPLEGMLQSPVQKYATASPEEMTVEVARGSLTHIRKSNFPLEKVLQHLSVAEAIPSPDGPYVGDEGVHDYAIFAKIDDIQHIPTEVDQQLERQLDTMLRTLLASAQGMYAREHESGEPARLSTAQMREATAQVQQWERQVDAALERFDVDATVLRPQAETENATTTVLCGLYRRTNSDDPNSRDPA